MTEAAKKTATVDAEVLSAEDAEKMEAFRAMWEKEVAEEAAIAKREEPLLDAIQREEGGVDLITRRAEGIAKVRRLALRQTNPENWVAMRAKDGKTICFPDKDAALTIGDVFGVETYDFRPKPAGKDWTPDEATDDDGNRVLTGSCSAYCRLTGRREEVVRASKSDAEDFTGREKKIAPGDLELSLLTLLRSKSARLCTATTKVPVPELEEAWDGTTKTFDRVGKGSGFGSAAERQAKTTDTPADVKTAAEALRKDILERVGEDPTAARDLLVEITKSKAPGGFKGHKTIDTFKTTEQVGWAVERLKKHEIFGDNARKRDAEGTS